MIFERGMTQYQDGLKITISRAESRYNKLSLIYVIKANLCHQKDFFPVVLIAYIEFPHILVPWPQRFCYKRTPLDHVKLSTSNC